MWMDDSGNADNRQQGMLNNIELEHYRRDGQIAVSDGLPAAFIVRARTMMERLFRERPELGTDFVPGLVEIDREWLELARAPEILNAVEQILGADIIVWGSSLFCKSAIEGKATPWHQDGQYWPIRPLETVTAWIAIDAATPENGCLRVIHGSHASKEVYTHTANDSDAVVLNQEIDLTQLANPSPHDVALESGMFSLHDVYLVHGAEPNRSRLRRAGLVFRYMPATSHYDRELAKRQTEELGVLDLSWGELHLVRGRNVHPGNAVIAQG
jgi:hypothetical protein